MNPRRIEIRGDTGWASLGCAVPLFLLGASVLAFPPAGVWGTGFLGLIFVGMGVWGGLWRQRLILDADAEEIARLLRLPLLDDCTQEEVLVQPDLSDASAGGVNEAEDQQPVREPRKPWRPVMPPWRK